VPVTRSGGPQRASDDGPLLALFGAIAAQRHREVMQKLGAAPELATRSMGTGASRQDPDTYFLPEIHHHVYAGDTALHIVAAALQPQLVESLLQQGADVGACNRRGAQPLHYAADGSLGGTSPNRAAQSDVIAALVAAGADPDAKDKSGAAPLHRAVRTRSSVAVIALLVHGADPLLMNKSGSTPLHLAVQNTGKSNSGSDRAKDEQGRIITILLAHGGSPDDVDAKGKRVVAAATSEWVRRLLGRP